MNQGSNQTWKTDQHNKEHKVTKIIRTNKQKLMRNSDSTKNWEHIPGAPVGLASFAFLETPAELLIKSQVRDRRKRKRKTMTR